MLPRLLEPELCGPTSELPVAYSIPNTTGAVNYMEVEAPEVRNYIPSLNPEAMKKII